ncbi:MAG: GGDEF domain-containing protein [Alphaproteobacteria bacterium]|nr:GGDEF domain-containing protein [Alphaproteobacteria bacterium]
MADTDTAENNGAISFSAAWKEAESPYHQFSRVKSPYPLPTYPYNTPYHHNPMAELERLREENAQLKKALLIDPKTGLNSETGFNNKFETILGQKLSGRHDTRDIALIFIDLDGFKPVNDAYGHPAGDKYFEIFGQRIKHFFREDDILARLGGDEFAILAVDTDVETITKKMDHIFQESKKWVFGIFGDQIAFRGFSYGISSTNELQEKMPVKEAMHVLNVTADNRTLEHKQRADKAPTSERCSAESIHVRNLAL